MTTYELLKKLGVGDEFKTSFLDWAEENPNPSEAWDVCPYEDIFQLFFERAGLKIEYDKIVDSASVEYERIREPAWEMFKSKVALKDRDIEVTERAIFDKVFCRALRKFVKTVKKGLKPFKNQVLNKLTGEK